jgi:hypothetical protein
MQPEDAVDKNGKFYPPPWVLRIYHPESEEEFIEKENLHFRDWVEFTESPPKKPKKGEHDPIMDMHLIRYGNLFLDFDDGKNLTHALEDTRRAVTHLMSLGFGPSAVDIYYSGSKGFHLEILDQLLGMQDGHEYLPRIYRTLVLKWKSAARLETVDLSVYAERRGKMIRLPNRRRANGRYKIPITAAELFTLTADEIVKLGEQPRYLEREECPLDQVLDLSEIVAEVETSKATFAEENPSENPSAISPANSEVLDGSDLPSCITYILKELPKPKCDNTFNRLLFNVFNFFIDHRIPWSQSYS